MQGRLFFALGLLVMFGLVGCEGALNQPGPAMRIARQPVEGANVEQGRQLLYDYGCGTCHTIPGVPRAHTHVGPPLTDWSQRHYIAGSLPNTLDNLVIWIMYPQLIEPNTAMPVLGVTQEEARHMSAYLYTLGN